MKTGPLLPSTLPPLREGLSISFCEYTRDGTPQWLIHDPGRNKFFMIGWIEHEIIKRWSLRDPGKIIEAVSRESTLRIDLGDIESLLRFLTKEYLIQQSSTQIHTLAKIQKLFSKDNWITWLIHSYLFFKVPLVNPDKFLKMTARVGTVLFHPYVGFFMLFWAVVALYQLGMQWDEFTHTFSTIFTWQGLFLYFIVFSVCKLIHELGHAYMCRRYGIPVPNLGVAVMVFWPVLYTDTTLSWSLDSKKRMRIALAGLWAESYITILAALIWCNTDIALLKSICYLTIAVNWTASLLINASPFMRFDGYYILMDFLKMPNLQSRAFALTRWQIRRWLFDWPDPPPEHFSARLHWLLVAYSLLTWIYRLSIYLGIGLLVYHFFIKMVGILLLAIEMIFFILRPFYLEIYTWILLKDRFSWNIHLFSTLWVSGIIFIFLFMPINNTIRLPATLSHDHQFLFAPDEGILETPLPQPGTTTPAHTIIARIVSPNLEYELKNVQLEYEKKSLELRRASVDKNFALQKSVLQSDLKKQQAEYERLLEQKNKLSLQVPFDSIVIETASELRPGHVVMKNEWLGNVINPKQMVVEAYAPQTAVDLLRPQLEGYFYPEDASEAIVPVTVLLIEPLNSTQLTCQYSSELKQDKNQSQMVETPCYHANELGGKIASFLSEEGNFVPVDSVYRVILKVNKPISLNYIERGTVILKTPSYAYATRLFYKARKIFLEESGF